MLAFGWDPRLTPGWRAVVCAAVSSVEVMGAGAGEGATGRGEAGEGEAEGLAWVARRCTGAGTGLCG